SMVFPLITRFFWGDIDLRWFPEACLSHPRYRGYFTVRDFVDGSSMPGSGVLPILEWRKKKLSGEAMQGNTPLQIADSLEEASAAALSALPGLRAANISRELRATLFDIEAMGRLAHYYALKIRAAASLALYDRSSAAPEKEAAVGYLNQAVHAWRD